MNYELKNGAYIAIMTKWRQLNTLNANRNSEIYRPRYCKIPKSIAQDSEIYRPRCKIPKTIAKHVDGIVDKFWYFKDNTCRLRLY